MLLPGACETYRPAEQTLLQNTGVRSLNSRTPSGSCLHVRFGVRYTIGIPDPAADFEVGGTPL
jgi:hypothetical protein